MTTQARIAFEDLRSFAKTVLTAAGVEPFSVAAIADGLCETSVRGIDSHGIRLLPHYVRSALSGRKNPKPDFRFQQTFPAFGHLDADNAFGHAAGMRAVEEGMAMARTQGLGGVAVSNSSHCGAMACFALHAARQGFACFAFTNADSLLQSSQGTRPYFGTNPVCFAAPREGMEPYCLDMATSVIPWNRLLLHKSLNTELPPAVAADSEGNETSDPAAAAWLLPVGGYKGYGLASMVEVLCSIFSGMAFGRQIPAMYKAPMDQPRRLGQFYLVMRTDAAVDADAFARALAEMSREIAAEPAQDADRPVMLPGDREVVVARHRMETGIPLDPDTLVAFRELAATYATPLPIF